ncbi:MAG: hypothetical protein QXX30_04340 [Candidatus Aenigmatarchaeota archaeon]
MEKAKKITTSCFLIIILIFNVYIPTLANNQNFNIALEKLNKLPAEEKEILQNAIKNPRFENFSKMSLSDQQLIRKITEKPNIYLSVAEIWNDQTVLIYNTSDQNVKIANTGGYLEIVRIINENTFTINGEEHYFEYEYEYKEDFSINVEASTMDKYDDIRDVFPTSSPSWTETSNPGGGWTYTGSSWHNLYLTNSIGNYTIGVLAILIGIVVDPLDGALFGAAALLLNSAFTNSSVAKFYKMRYNHATLPQIYRHEAYHCYAVWQGQDHFLGVEFKYFVFAPNY